MAALAYNLGKREINHYFSVRSAKVLALVAVLLLAACHLASRRYRGGGLRSQVWAAVPRMKELCTSSLSEQQ
uniref:CAS1 domain containing 1 n=1 Tax=Mus musculus TaxID=10090 RepID=A0A0N4SWB0_MOUSE